MPTASINQTFSLTDGNSFIGHFINFGTFGNLDKIGFWISNAKGISTITNYGVMGSINYHNATTPLTLNNLGLIGAGEHIEVKNGSKVLIKNYMVKITETAATFNNFSKLNNQYTNFSHLVINDNSGGDSVAFKDNNSKVILDFDNGFEFGKEYKINKIAVDERGNPYKDLGVDFSRLTVTSDIYLLSQRGDNFVVDFVPQYGIIGTLHKSNIRTMNNFYTLSNSMIYPRKLYHLQNLRISSLRDLPTANRGNPHYENIVNSTLDSAISLKSYESFSYRNESINRRIQRQNKRNYSRQSRNLSQNLKADSTNKTNKTNQNNLRDSANRDYYFILTPFVNHNLFFESGRYNLSGLEYGFLTAFSGSLTPSNMLGTHFMMSYGNIGDSKDKDLSIKSLNLNLGINYKLDLIYDMYLKARGDFFYFLNQVKTLTMLEAIKPNNLGFGASVSYGKDFNFGKGGVLGIEAGIDYKTLKTNAVSLNSQSYKQSLLNLIYADLGVSYSKYFGGFGINLGTGFKANLAPKLAESILILNSQNLRFTLDNDKYLAYTNAGISYVLNTKNFDMEFSLAYYGNFGDRVISNGGGVEMRVVF